MSLTRAKDMTTLTTPGQTSAGVELFDRFNVSVSGTFVATVVFERSFDAGLNWGAVSSYTGATEEVGLRIEPERGVLYRFRLSGYTSGSVLVRASQ